MGNSLLAVRGINHKYIVVGRDGTLYGNGNANPVLERGKQTVNIIADKTKPTVSNIRVTGVTRGYYTVTATATDDIGVKEVKFPTWTSKNGQDDLKWISGTKLDNTTWQCKIQASDHNMEAGEYITHVYAYDAAGNSVGVAAPAVKIPDVTENTDVNEGDSFEAHIVNSAAEYYLYQSVNTVIDTKHWDLLSVKYNAKNIQGLQPETWIFSRQNDSSYTIQNKHSGKYLEIANSGRTSGTKVVLADLNTGGENDNQRFRLYKTSQGYFITAKCTPYTVLGISGFASGSSVYANYYDPVDIKQIFKIVRLDQTGNDSEADNNNNSDGNEENEENGIVSSISNGSGKKIKGSKGVILSAKNKAKRNAVIRWKRIEGANGYQIQYALSKKKLSKGKKINTNKTSMTIKKLKKKKTYYVRVRAYKVVGSRNVYGKWSAVKKVKIKK